MDPNAGTSLPFHAAPHDSLRLGLPSLREDAISTHPVQGIQEQPASRNKALMLKDLYGAAFPAKLQIEQQILGRFERLPGLPSSKLGLEALTGALDEFGFESYLGQPQDSEVPAPDMHSQMEARLGLADGTQPVARGGIW